MRKVIHILTLAAVLLAVSVTAFGQVQPTFTTLSAAIADERVTRMSVTSATGFTASNQATGAEYYAFIDRELVRIRAVTGTTITIERGQARTNATPHRSGARVFVGPFASQQGAISAQSGGPFIQTPMVGSCTRSTYAVLPLIQVNMAALQGQALYDCLGGVWQQGTLPQDTFVEPLIGGCNIPIGSVAYASVGTNTTDVANKRMVTSIIVPRSGIFTGIQVLQGGTATTDNITAGLYDSIGTPIANTGATGVLLAGASTFKNLPFTAGAAGGAQTLTLVTGPALYFIGVTGNGTAAGAYQTVPTATFKNLFSQATTSITFGTFPSFTVPSTFTADLAPVVCFYN